MEYFTLLWAVMSYVENKTKGELNYKELERITGYSTAHIREIFVQHTRCSLAKYLLLRKIENIAFEIIHTDNRLKDIWPIYGFKNADSFTRAFRRITGVNPGQFKKTGIPVGRKKLYTGAYGVGFQDDRLLLKMQIQSIRKGTDLMNNSIDKKDQNTLYNVPKVGYGIHGCTPFPICLKACTDYLGEDISHAYIMAASGAAFRLTWDESCWEGGNVDVGFTYDSFEKMYETGLGCVSSAYSIMSRNSKSKKEEFKNFIISNIDKGNPVIALGIIGPPEAGLVTGYRDYGETLLGWNFFQDIPDFGGVVQKDETGYYICSNWWENKNTNMLMALGDVKKDKYDLKHVLGNAIVVLEGRRVGSVAKGVTAYDSWKNAIMDEREFSEGITMPNLAERLMCQGDGMDCISDGRKNVVLYLKSVVDEYPDVKEQIKELITLFSVSCIAAHDMFKICGGFQRGEKQMLLFKERSIRVQIAKLIDKAKAADIKALTVMKELHSNL